MESYLCVAFSASLMTFRKSRLEWKQKRLKDLLHLNLDTFVTTIPCSTRNGIAVLQVVQLPEMTITFDWDCHASHGIL